MIKPPSLAAVFFVFAFVALVPKANAQYTLQTATWNTLPFTNFDDFEAVDSTGTPTYMVTGPILAMGVVLNTPADMTDSHAGDPNGTVDPAQPPTSGPGVAFNPNPYWQMYLQTVDVNHNGDFGGAAIYAAQNYGNVPPALTFPGGVPTPDPTQSYTAQGWYQDVQRISTGVANNVNALPAVTNSPIVAGDLVMVEALGSLTFGGKQFLNEEHMAEDPETQFQLVNLGYVGLPTATPLHLADIWNNSTNAVLFDQTRASGGEHFESTLVQLKDVTLASGQASNWNSNGFVTVQDSFGRRFTLELGSNAAFTPANAPTGMFNITGIFDKESPSSGTANTTGYQLWVMDPTTVISVPASASFTWIATSGTLNNAANWIEGAPSGLNTDQLTFGNAATSSYSATVDGTHGPWTTNNLTFSNTSSVAGTINRVNAGSLVLSGAPPSITQLGAGAVVFSAPVQFSANGSISGSGTGDVTFTGGVTLAPSVALQQSVPGTVEIDVAPTLNSGSSLQVQSGILLLKVISGSATIGTGVTATVAAGATLQLAGSVAALAGSNTVDVTNNGSTASGGGFIVTGTNQSVGAVTGSATTISGTTTYGGDTVVGDGGAGESLTATQILQNSLTINAGATLTIVPSDSGNATASSASANAATASGALSSVMRLVRAGDATSATSIQDIKAIDAELAAADPNIDAANLDSAALALQAELSANSGESISRGLLLEWLRDADAMIVAKSFANEKSLGNLEGNLLFGANYQSLLDQSAPATGLPTGAAAVPEPSSLALIAIGVIGLAALLRKRGGQIQYSADGHAAAATS